MAWSAILGWAIRARTANAYESFRTGCTSTVPNCAAGFFAAHATASFDASVSLLAIDVIPEPEKAAAEISSRYDCLDVLINNAGINYDTWETVENAEIDGTVIETIRTNLLGPWRMCQAFLPLLRKSRAGRIVNVSSESGSLANMGAGPPAYQITKAALNALTRTLAGELRGTSILVNAVCPGWVATDMGGTGGRPVADGANGILWAATLPDNGPTGGFFRDGKPLPW